MSGQSLFPTYPFHAYKKELPSPVLAVLIVLIIVLVISRINNSEISFMWYRAQERFKMAKMGMFPSFLFHALYDSDEPPITVNAHNLKGCAKGYTDTYFRKTTFAAGASSRGPPLPRGITLPSISFFPSCSISQCNVKHRSFVIHAIKPIHKATYNFAYHGLMTDSIALGTVPPNFS